MRLLDQRNLSFVDSSYLLVCAFFLLHLSQWWNCLSKKTINCYRYQNRSYGVAVNFNIFKKKSKIWLPVNCFISSMWWCQKKKSLQLDYVFLLCVRISTSSYFVLRQLSLCRYLTDQLQKVYVVNETNKVGVIDHTDVFGISIKLYSWPLTLMFVIKDFVIEALRSIAELMIYGDQHDPSFFE